MCEHARTDVVVQERTTVPAASELEVTPRVLSWEYVDTAYVRLL